MRSEDQEGRYLGQVRSAQGQLSRYKGQATTSSSQHCSFSGPRAPVLSAAQGPEVVQPREWAVSTPSAGRLLLAQPLSSSRWTGLPFTYCLSPPLPHPSGLRGNLMSSHLLAQG